jgi:uncharacterized protein (DUF305 family)
VLLSATVLGLAGCVNAEQAAPPGAGNSQSFGPAATTTSVAPISSPAAVAGAQHNAADVTFVNQSVQLRQQVLTIAGLAAKGSSNAQLQSLATDIAGGTGPSVTTMTGWLTQWSQPAPQSVAGQPGMLAAADLQQLQTLTGTPFDMHWLQDVHGNLTAAQQLASTETSKGSNPQAKALAQQWTTQLKAQLATLATITG